MTSRSLWRRGLFEPAIVHLPAPDGRSRYLTRNRVWVHDTLCDRFLRVHEPEGDGTMRCPDCSKQATDGQHDDSDGQLPASGGGPAASAR